MFKKIRIYKIFVVIVIINQMQKYTTSNDNDLLTNYNRANRLLRFPNKMMTIKIDFIQIDFRLTNFYWQGIRGAAIDFKVTRPRYVPFRGNYNFDHRVSYHLYS